MKLPAFDTPAGKLLRLPLRLVPQEATVRILRGPMRGMKWIAGASNHGCWLGLYEPDFQGEFLSLIPENGVVWDVGANVGYYSLLASRKARKVQLDHHQTGESEKPKTKAACKMRAAS